MPGDGIGNDVMEATKIVLDQIEFDAEYVHADIGWEFWCSEGEALPERTIELLENVDASLFGAITSKPKEEAQAELAPEPGSFRSTPATFLFASCCAFCAACASARRASARVCTPTPPPAARSRGREPNCRSPAAAAGEWASTRTAARATLCSSTLTRR